MHALRQRFQQIEVGPICLEPGYPWENGWAESVNGKLQVELLNGIFYTLQEAQIIIEQWRRLSNTHRPHSALGYRPLTPETRNLIDLVAKLLGVDHKDLGNFGKECGFGLTVRS